MPRGNQLALILLLLVMIGGTAAWLYFSRRQKEFIPAAIALPRSAMIIYQGHTPVQDLKGLDHNALFNEFSSNPGISSLMSDFRFLDSLFGKEVLIREMLKERPLIVSVHATSSQRFQLLFLLQTEGHIDAGEVKRWAEKKWEGARIFQRLVKGKKVYDVKGHGKERLFSFALVENIFVVSRNTILVEDAIAAAVTNSVKSSPLLTELVKREAESRLYVNYRTFPDLLTAYSTIAASGKGEELKNVMEFGSYSWRFTENTLKLTGSAYARFSDAFAPLLNQEPKSLGMANVIPSSCAVLTQYGVNSFAEYFKNRSAIRKKSYEAEIQELADKKAISLDKDILPLLGDQWGYAILDPGEPTSDPVTYLAAALNDSSAGWKAWTTLNGKAAASGDAEFKGRTYRDYSIHLFSMPEVLPWLFGEEYVPEGKVYYTRIDNFIVFAGNDKALERAIDAFEDGQTLSGTSSYKEFAVQAGDSLNFSLYINPSRAQALAQEYLSVAYKDRFMRNLPVYLRAGSLGFTLTASGNYFFSQIIVNRTDIAPTRAEVVWSLKMEADAATKPFIVQDPDTRQKEVLIQDKNQNLYLIGASGKVLWKKDLEEPVIGEVYQIDLYRNNDLQYLFATTNKVYLVNRQGNPAANYPIRLGAPTNTGVAMFDFAGSRDYTYYVGTENGRIYGFGGNGRPLQGWSPLAVDGPITVPVKYFNVQKKDYLFSVTQKGNLYIWNKEGRNVMKPIALETYFRNPFKMEFGQSLAQSALFSVDTLGMLYTIFLDGKIQRREFPEYPNPFFEYYDSDRNGKPEYILSSDTVIASFQQSDTPVWRIRVPETLLYRPQLVSAGNETYIAYTASSTNQLYLVRRNGGRYTGFPANGNSFITVTDIDTDGMPEFIAPAEGQLLYMYRLTR
jgi:hypothetical protein